MSFNEQAALKEHVRHEVISAADELVALSHEIHANPELAFEEVRACRSTSTLLERFGYEIDARLCSLETAFRARSGGGSLRVALCAEYDALPRIGHACGHNVIAAAAVGAATGLSHVGEQLDLSVEVLGTPAEEDGGGKIFLLERGAFEGVHAALMVHPAPFDIAEPTVLGVDWIEARYIGKASHASAAPEEGIDAADAAVLAHTAIGLLRGHLDRSSRVHGVIRRAGDAPNIVPDLSELAYMVRATSSEQLAAVRERAERCFEAGAIATGCQLEFAPRRRAYAPMRHDPRLTSRYRSNAEALGRSFYDSRPEGQRWAASTDMGNVSQYLPAAQPLIGLSCAPATNHQPEFAVACVSAAADRAVIDGAIAMAWTVLDIAHDEQFRAALTEEDLSARATPGISRAER
jgi:amidohydrolase